MVGANFKVKEESIKYLVNILMGAVYSDKKFEGSEMIKVDQILNEMFEGNMPEFVKEQIKNFDPNDFDPKFNIEMLLKIETELFKDKNNKRKILELVASINEADEELAVEENEYLCNIANYLGLEEEDYKDLKLEIISIEDIKPIVKMMLKPPPIPKESKQK